MNASSRETESLKILYLLGWGAFLISVLILGIKLLQTPSFWLDMVPYYFADALQLAGFHKSVVSDGANWFDWITGASPYLFPDVILYFLLSPITEDVQNTLVAYAVVQIILLVISLQFLANSLFGKTPRLIKFSILLGCTWICVILTQSLLTSTSYSAFLPALVPAFHFGALLSLIFSLGFCLRLLEAQSLQKTITLSSFLFCISFLTVLSDFIYIVQAVVPMVVCLFFFALKKWTTWWRSLLLSMLLIISSLLGMWLNLVYLTQGAKEVFSIVEGSASNTQTLIKLGYWGLVFMKEHIVYSCALVLFLMVTVVFVGRYFRRETPAHDGAHQKIIFLLSFFLVLCVINVGVVMLLKIFVDMGGTRYFLPLLLMPVCIGLPVLLHFSTLSKKIIERKSAIVALCGLALLVPLTEARGIKVLAGSTPIYPDVTACLDSYAEQYKLQNGLGAYCSARPYYLFSKKELFIAHILPDFLPHGLFAFSDYEKVPFDFVIIEFYLTEETVVERFGEPAASFFCGETKVLVYDSDAFKHQFAHREVFQETYYGQFYRS